MDDKYEKYVSCVLRIFDPPCVLPTEPVVNFSVICE